MDLLSDVLRVVKPEGALFFNGEFSGSWCLAHPDQILKHLSRLFGIAEVICQGSRVRKTAPLACWTWPMPST